MSKYPHKAFIYKKAGHHSPATFNQLSQHLEAKCSTLKIKHSNYTEAFNTSKTFESKIIW